MKLNTSYEIQAHKSLCAQPQIENDFDKVHPRTSGVTANMVRPAVRQRIYGPEQTLGNCPVSRGSALEMMTLS